MFPTIQSLSDWGNVFQSILCFEKIIRDISAKEQLPVAPVSNLTPGTNAVFRVGDLVYKIFAPKQSGFDPEPVFQQEVEATRAAREAGILAPEVLASGMITDQYDFYYLILEFIDAEEAGGRFDRMEIGERVELGGRMRDILAKLSRMSVASAQGNAFTRAMENPRWRPFNMGFLEERKQEIDRLHAAYAGKEIYVHGDLTGENVLIRPNGDLYIIDFADGCMAPPLYEYAPLFHELFQRDPAPMRSLLKSPDEQAAVEITSAILLHEFGADMAKNLLNALSIPPSQAGVGDLRRAIKRRFGIH